MKIIKYLTILFLFYGSLHSIYSFNSGLDSIPANMIYRYYAGEYKGYRIWIVDGFNIRTSVFGEFVYGGNSARYTFVPKGEIWIDNAVSASEYITTLEHEINECNLMYNDIMDYYDAHDSSLSLELNIRDQNSRLSREHELILPEVEPYDFDTVKEISSLPDKIKLMDVYIYKLGIYEGNNVWVVDGYFLRKNIYPDFGFSGNSSAYRFIPKNEIWIDGNVSSEEIWYSILLEENEKLLMDKNEYYDEAYMNSLIILTKKRRSDNYNISLMNYLLFLDPLYRDIVK